MDSDIDVVGQ